jgi:hypothetical protein
MLEHRNLFRIESIPYEHKPSNPLALTQLRGDAEAASAKWPRNPPSDRDTARKLIEQEPFKARWGGMSVKTIQTWLHAMREFFKRPEDVTGCPEK